MIKAKRSKPEYVKCAYCKRPIHIDDLGVISTKGLFHKECCFRVLMQDPNSFITGYEVKIRKENK